LNDPFLYPKLHNLKRVLQLFPRLRFKKFDGDWEKTTIGAKSETVTSGSRDWAQYYSDSGDKFIRMTNLVRNGINLDLSDLRFVQLPVGSNEGKRTSLEKGDILISITAELGKLGWIPEGLGTAYINQHTALVRMKNTLDSKFVAYALSTEKYNNKLNSLNDSGAKAGLNLGSIRSFELTIPSKLEQTKIASFLSAVDEKISQLTQKHELLSQYKQGMMQKLFSQQIRFKADDGREFGEWEEKKLGEISKTFSGGTPQSSNKSFYEGSIPFIKSGEISQDITEQHINEIALQKSSAKLVNKGDLLYALYGATSGQVAISQIDGAINQAVLCIRSTLNTQYLLNFFLLKKEEILSTYLQGGQGNLSAAILKEIYIPIPCMEEQTKIANFLSAIDQKIEVVAQQIEQAKTWKKGLLQQMFV
jgi:type I restriction enzyme S subunit